MFFNRLGEIRDRSFEQQRYQTSGLNLVTAAIVLEHGLSGTGNQCFERARQTGRQRLFQYPVTAGWEHINLTGDYLWRGNTAKVGAGKFRPLRPLPPA